MLAEAQHGGQNQDAGVADLHAAIVVVQCMSNTAVGQRSVCSRDFHTRAEYGCLRRSTEFGRVTCDSLAHWLANSCERSTNAIECRALGFLDSAPWYALEACLEDELRNFFSSTHTSPRKRGFEDRRAG